jgi:hypothetical protein
MQRLINAIPAGPRHPLDPGPSSPYFVVVDGSGAMVETFRNEHLANRLAATNPSYQVTGSKDYEQ